MMAAKEGGGSEQVCASPARRGRTLGLPTLCVRVVAPEVHVGLRQVCKVTEGQITRESSGKLHVTHGEVARQIVGRNQALPDVVGPGQSGYHRRVVVLMAGRWQR